MYIYIYGKVGNLKVSKSSEIFRLGWMLQMPLIQLIQMLKINLWMQFKVCKCSSGSCSSESTSGSHKSKSSSSPGKSNSHSRSCSSNSSSRSCTGWSKHTSSTTTTTSPSTTSPCRYGSAHYPNNLSKLDRKET